MSKEAWGRWGPEDERGALNFIGAEQVRRARGAGADGAGAEPGAAAFASDPGAETSRRCAALHGA